MKEKLQRNVTVIDLVVGILIYGIICEIVGMFIVGRRLYYTLGILIGILSAAAMALHMNYTIGIALSCDEKNAIAVTRKYVALRYAAAAVVLGILILFPFADPIAAFIGMMGLKIAAYLQPFTHKLVRRFLPDLPPAPSLEELEKAALDESSEGDKQKDSDDAAGMKAEGTDGDADILSDAGQVEEVRLTEKGKQEPQETTATMK